jgi:hypothetical protein
MTWIVLALAGLTAGDGGPGVGAATAPVRLQVEGDWVGTWDMGGGDPFRMELWRGALRMWNFQGQEFGDRCVCSIRLGEGGRGTVTLGPAGQPGRTYPAIYAVVGGQVLIAFGARQRPARVAPGPEAILLTLRPVAPPKP